MLQRTAAAKQPTAAITGAVAFITDASPVQRILTHIGEPPLIAPACGSPAWDDGLDSLPDWDTMAQPEPEYVFDQQVQW